jgi:hypothetical protein
MSGLKPPTYNTHRHHLQHKPTRRSAPSGPTPASFGKGLMSGLKPPTYTVQANAMTLQPFTPSKP